MMTSASLADGGSNGVNGAGVGDRGSAQRHCKSAASFDSGTPVFDVVVRAASVFNADFADGVGDCSDVGVS
jgi:hypothetical protein